MSRRALPLTLIAGALGSILGIFLLLGACADESPPNPSGGQGGAAPDGGCLMTPQPIFTVTISAEEGTVPPDTSLTVTWSEGEEPVFKLNDPSTWSSLDDANVICDVDPSKPPPTDLAALVCRLWTSGATAIEVKAEGYRRHAETLVPMKNEECEGPVPEEVLVTLTAEEDAGPPP
ncbi:MAG TPA: hypothetical protein VE093_22400 [Polyangiaceae bacterium]|nr:hypothetical protein [Polyangiaceae bacterium]